MECPYNREAEHMIGILVQCVSEARTWQGKKEAIEAILDVRLARNGMVKEWEHLNGNKNNPQSNSDFIPDSV